MTHAREELTEEGEKSAGGRAGPAATAAAGDELGTSVGISGDIIVAGAPLANIRANTATNGNIAQGAAYVFVKPSGGWANGTETAKLTASDGAAGDELGTSVGISGDAIVAGAPLANIRANTATNGNIAQGAAYVFVKPSGGWANGTETAKLTASDGAAGDELGRSAAVSGNILAAGAPFATVDTIPGVPAAVTSRRGRRTCSSRPRG
jgi:hypothetical protein